MQKIGIESVILFVAALVSFLIGVGMPQWRIVGFIFCALFFVAAIALLAFTIKKRAKTRIG